MIQLGVTGGIGSGKTTVCNVLEHFGIPVYNADEEAKKLLNTQPIQKKVIQVFGNGILDESGAIDRKKLAAQVFLNQERLEVLNSIIHPALAVHYANWLKSKKHNPIVAKEAAILFESGSYKGMDKIVSVYAPQELRIKRAMQRTNTSRSEIMSRIKKQLPEKEKMKRSDFVLYNNEKKMLLPQLILLLKQLNYSFSD
ncbi:MAG: dephospho-CoA kinase [Bacteroidetes bacterium]|nr:dephospho-CoA kinase [Bacteroidota bacterium]